MAVEFETFHNQARNETSVKATFSNLDVMLNDASFRRALFDEIVQGIASQWVKEHYAEVAAKLDPQAIANLTIAESAAAINATLHKKMPDKITEIVKTEVYQRGIFGGLKRI